MVPFDTKPEISALQMDLLRRKSPAERFELARQVTFVAQRIAFAVVRSSRPELTDEEVWVQLAVDRLGADVVRKVRARAAARSV